MTVYINYVTINNVIILFKGGSSWKKLIKPTLPNNTPGPEDFSPLSVVEGSQWKEVLNTFLESLSLRTRVAYGEAFEDFAEFIGTPTPAQAVFHLFGQAPGEANRLILSYRSHLTQRAFQVLP